MGCSQRITKLSEELQNITKQSCTMIAKLSKTKALRKIIARILTIIKEKKEEEEFKTTIKYLKIKQITLDLYPRLTRVKKKKKND